MRLVQPTPDPAKGWRARMFWSCTRFPGCKGKHGAHQENGDPLGVPANEKTRKARMAAHDLFDQLWKTPGWFTRNGAYAWLSGAMGQVMQVHIGSATAEECEEICRLAQAKTVELTEQAKSVERRRRKDGKWKMDRKKERRGERS